MAAGFAVFALQQQRPRAEGARAAILDYAPWQHRPPAERPGAAVVSGELFVMAAAGAAPETGDLDALCQRGPVASGECRLDVMLVVAGVLARRSPQVCIRLYVI